MQSKGRMFGIFFARLGFLNFNRLSSLLTFEERRSSTP